jgi:predicted metallo-beta-lactamase superfamily hydrolase
MKLKMMLKHIHVTPLAAESLGVRSMCTYIETNDVRILLDAGVSLCPSRFGLPPHPKEFEAIINCRKKIADAAAKADVVTLSHYHFDHHTPSYEDWLVNWTEQDETARQIYEGKTVLVKNPRERINSSQRQRGWMFQRTAGRYAGKLEIADEKSFVFGETRIRFSEPVFHGSEDTFLGWILMAVIECEDEKFMFAPDVQGPMSRHICDLILQEKPQLLIIGGPPTYLAGFRVAEAQIEDGLMNLTKIVENVPLTIMDHHVLREENWRDRTERLFTKAEERKHEILTSSEFLGKNNECLEAERKRLYLENPPSAEFEKWMRMSDDSKRLIKPPI